jgi:hypothetical protein
MGWIDEEHKESDIQGFYIQVLPTSMCAIDAGVEEWY